MKGCIQMLRDGIAIHSYKFINREQLKERMKWFDVHYCKYNTHHIYELSIIFNV